MARRGGGTGATGFGAPMKIGMLIIGLIVSLWVVSIVIGTLKTSVGATSTNNTGYNETGNPFYQAYNFIGLTTASGGAGALQIIGVLSVVGILYLSFKMFVK